MVRISTRQNFHQGTFARSVAADDAVNLAGTQVEIDVFKRDDSVKPLANPTAFE